MKKTFLLASVPMGNPETLAKIFSWIENKTQFAIMATVAGAAQLSALQGGKIVPVTNIFCSAQAEHAREIYGFSPTVKNQPETCKKTLELVQKWSEITGL